MLHEACHCTIDRSGQPVGGCACITFEEGPYGPRAVESRAKADGSGAYLELVQARVDAEAHATRQGGPPAGSLTSKATRTRADVAGLATTLDEYGTMRRR